MTYSIEMYGFSHEIRVSWYSSGILKYRYLMCIENMQNNMKRKLDIRITHEHGTRLIIHNHPLN